MSTKFVWVPALLVFCFISHWWKERMNLTCLQLTSEFEACSIVLLRLKGPTSSRLVIDLGGTGSGSSPMPTLRKHAESWQPGTDGSAGKKAFSMTTHNGAAQDKQDDRVSSTGWGGLAGLLCTVLTKLSLTPLFPPLPDLLLQCCTQDPNSMHVSFYSKKKPYISTFLAVLTILALQKRKVRQT